MNLIERMFKEQYFVLKNWFPIVQTCKIQLKKLFKTILAKKLLLETIKLPGNTDMAVKRDAVKVMAKYMQKSVIF